MNKRLDQWLVDLFKIPSKTKAQEIIKNGSVSVKGKVSLKPGQKIEEEISSTIKIMDHDVLKFVSRGGLKLEGAISHLGIEIAGLNVLDVGCSTGGFSHCVLELGAGRVVGIDVGTEQIAEDLKAYENFSCHEGFHVDELLIRGQELLPGQFDLVVADLSFISLSKVIRPMISVMKAQGFILALVKPQFELSAQALNKNGIVKSKEDFKKVERQIKMTFQEQNISVLDYFKSTLPGKDGNQEFFIYGQIY